MGEFDRYLQTDLKTAKKIQENPAYYDRLLKADKIIKDLKFMNEENSQFMSEEDSQIMSESQFYAYAMVLEDLSGITYQDMQSFQRFKSEEYYKEVQSHLNSHQSNIRNGIKRIK